MSAVITHTMGLSNVRSCSRVMNWNGSDIGISPKQEVEFHDESITAGPPHSAAALNQKLFCRGSAHEVARADAAARQACYLGRSRPVESRDEEGGGSRRPPAKDHWSKRLSIVRHDR